MASSGDLRALHDWRRDSALTLRAVRDERDRLIGEALAAGHSQLEVAAALGISQQALSKFLARRGQK